MCSASSVRLLALPLLLCLCAALPASAQATSDLWDVSQGAAILSHSGTVFDNTTAPEGMLGGNNSGIPGPGESGVTIFQDARGEGFVHFIEWQTPALVTVNRFDLFAVGDGPDGYHRAYARFRLLYWTGAEFSLLYDYTPASSEVGDLTITDTIPITIADRWRAEFYNNAGTGGPRVVELDAFAVPAADAPEPSAFALLAPFLPVIGALIRRRRGR